MDVCNLTPLFCVSARTTHMDIMCTTTTAVRSGHVGKKKLRCKLPYDDRRLPSSQGTFTQTLVDKVAQQRVHAALIEERRSFFARLDRDRETRLVAEAAAAVALQRIYRGFRSRPRTLRAVPHEDLSHELVLLAQAAGLAPSPDLALKKNKKQRLAEKHEQRQQHAAARTLQAVSRRLAATKLANRLRSERRAHAQRASVSEIQRCFRGHRARRHIRQQRSNKAAASIQTRYRHRIASKHHLHRKQLFERIAREQHAALRIQATSRASRARAGFLGLLCSVNPALLQRRQTDADDSPTLTWQDDK